MAKSIFTPEYRAILGVLIDARKNAGITQAQLGQRFGEDQSFISKIERGQRRLDIAEFYSLAIAVGVSPADLLDEAMVKIGSQTENLEVEGKRESGPGKKGRI